jgi:hypothetical protein
MAKTKGSGHLFPEIDESTTEQKKSTELTGVTG